MDLPAVLGTLKSLLSTTIQELQFFGTQPSSGDLPNPDILVTSS